MVADGGISQTPCGIEKSRQRAQERCNSAQTDGAVDGFFMGNEGKTAGDIDIEKLKSVKGVYEIIKEKDEYIVKIEEDSVVKKVFKSISTCDVTKFVVSEASLNEIFIASVGVAYE